MYFDATVLHQFRQTANQGELLDGEGIGKMLARLIQGNGSFALCPNLGQEEEFYFLLDGEEREKLDFLGKESTDVGEQIDEIPTYLFVGIDQVSQRVG